MDSSKPAFVPEHELTQYLLGKLQGEERERLDELSIADDEFAERLCIAENELVDAYVHSQLRSDALRDFESHYLATDLRRKKVAMARALFLAGAKADSSAEPREPHSRPDYAAANKRSLVWPPPLRFAWLATAAALLLCVTTTWLAIENHRLRQQDRASLAEHGILQKELQQLRSQIQNEQALQNRQTASAEESGPATIGQPSRLSSTIFLLPPSRGAAPIPVASVSAKDRWLGLQLALESDDFPQYQVDVVKLVDNTSVWRSEPIKSAEINHRRALSLVLPLAGLEPQRYAAEVSGIAASGRHEVLGNYVFTITQSTNRQGERR